jgi:hypothetical protein
LLMLVWPLRGWVKRSAQRRDGGAFGQV